MFRVKVEAKRLYNFALSFMNEHDINDFDTKILTVHTLDKDHQPVTHELQYLGSQMKQSVIQGIKHSLKALAALKARNHKVGGLRYKSDYVAINLQQLGATYRFYDEHHIGIQSFKKRIRIEGANQFWNIPDLEFANAKLLNLPDGYYLAITTFQNKGGEQKNYKPEIGIDMGIKTSATTLDGSKYHVLIEESEQLKKCQRLVARRKKTISEGSSNRYKALKKLRRAYQKLTSRKRDAANKIVHELLEHEHVYMQDENLKGWHSGKLKKDITLADRVYSCECGYSENRDIHAARNMILLSKTNTCGTQEIYAFGEKILRTFGKTLAEHRGATSSN